MITVIHGDDIESSRNFFYIQKQNLKNFLQVDGENLLFSEFFLLLEGSTLFNDKPTLFIENFITKNKLEDYKKIIEYINKNEKLEIIFWESAELTKTQQSLIKKVDLKTFSFSKNIFLFLDNMRPKNLKYLISLYKSLRESTSDEIIFFMITRQFRLLISLINYSEKNIDETKRLANWQVSKLKKQIIFFDEEKILKFYEKLFEADLALKTGRLPISYDKSIDFLLASL